jgi:predicted lipoprotein
MLCRFQVFLLAIAALAAAPAQAQPDYEELNRALTDQVVIPAYRRMAQAMAELDAATGSFCEDPSAAGFAATKQAFNHAMESWQRAQPITLGPVTWQGRAERVQFWPDKSGVAARQVGRALHDQSPDLVAAGGLEGRSVALQSLATHERLVFEHGEAIASGKGSAQDDYACALAVAIARFQAALAADILEQWVAAGGFRQSVITAAKGNSHYSGADEMAAGYLKSLSGTLDKAIRLKLERPLGASLEKARPKRAESWRSARSLDNIAANLETAEALYSVPGGFGDQLKAADAEALDSGLRRSFAEAIEMARAIGRPLHLAVTDEELRQETQALLQHLKTLRLLITGPVAGEIGLVLGFNALDGD